MYKQDRATTERHARILRELVKREENKRCADCKRNDARWASWNIGAFLCIRCSGIHRSMGTHISKVKSVDLDTWTPEQMDHIQKWGNHRVNLFWEAGLRPGHIPSESKMDSFIRSKYEAKSWVRDRVVPSDPSVLDTLAEGGTASTSNPTTSSAPTIPSRVTSLPEKREPTPLTSRQPQPHKLLSATTAGRSSPAPAVPAVSAALSTPQPVQETKPAPPQSDNDLFSLDFHAPPSQQQSQPQTAKKDVKNDIMSLFSSAPAASAVPNPAFGQFTSLPAAQPGMASMQMSADPWGAPVAQSQPQQQGMSMMGTTGWGAEGGWNPSNSTLNAAQQAQNDLWGGFTSNSGATKPAMGGGLFETQNVWGSSAGNGAANGGVGGMDLFGGSSTNGQQPAQKKDDAFGDLWGGFK